ncbi:MAG: 2-dehydro-3-deoxygalactonokinase, partial [Lautropia sp.]|nr:2-dehydro-3-deoxygalactonokinase [Lautropia sp.]
MTASPAPSRDHPRPASHRGPQHGNSRAAAVPPGVGIALDWGTTNLRAFLIDAAGAVREQREKPWGILSLPAAADAGGFDLALEAIVGDWLTAHPRAPLIASGMVGSAQGWREAPYVACPAGAGDLAASMTSVATAFGRDLMIVPGILLDLPQLLPDVMRGEETQVLGALQSLPGDDAPVCFVLPGTHSKWVLVRDARITQFATYMTGELFATLKQHSILGRLMTDPANDTAGAITAAAYLQGIALAREGAPGDLMRQLFTTRSMNLAGRLPTVALADYLSGLLIGNELASATAWLAREAGPDTPLVLVGEPALLARYQAALVAFGSDAARLPNTAAAGLRH